MTELYGAIGGMDTCRRHSVALYGHVERDLIIGRAQSRLRSAGPRGRPA